MPKFVITHLVMQMVVAFRGDNMFLFWDLLPQASEQETITFHKVVATFAEVM